MALPSAMRVHCDNYVSLLSFLLQNWNAYIGRLGRKDFCFNINKTEASGVRLEDVPSLISILSDDSGERHTVGVMINFTLDKAVLKSAKEAAEDTILLGTFTGSDFTTQIKGRYTCNSYLCFQELMTLDILMIEQCTVASRCVSPIAGQVTCTLYSLKYLRGKYFTNSAQKQVFTDKSFHGLAFSHALHLSSNFTREKIFGHSLSCEIHKNFQQKILG